MAEDVAVRGLVREVKIVNVVTEQHQYFHAPRPHSKPESSSRQRSWRPLSRLLMPRAILVLAHAR